VEFSKLEQCHFRIMYCSFYITQGFPREDASVPTHVIGAGIKRRGIYSSAQATKSLFIARSASVLPRVRRQSRHTGGNAETLRGRQFATAVPLLPRQSDAVRTSHPQLRIEVVACQNVVQPVRPILSEPRFLVQPAQARRRVA